MKNWINKLLAAIDARAKQAAEFDAYLQARQNVIGA